jgi:hypothetical protein
MQALPTGASELLQIPNFTSEEAKHCVVSSGTGKRPMGLLQYAQLYKGLSKDKLNEKLKVRVCGCVGVRMCGCVGVWVCGCVGVFFSHSLIVVECRASSARTLVRLRVRMAGFVWQGIKTMSDEEKSEVFKFLETIPILDVREQAVQNRACSERPGLVVRE